MQVGMFLQLPITHVMLIAFILHCKYPNKEDRMITIHITYDLLKSGPITIAKMDERKIYYEIKNDLESHWR